MRRFLLIFFCIAAISGAVFDVVSVSHDRVVPAVNGVLDLRREESEALAKNVYTLGGEWEFYWGRLYEPEDFADGLPEEKNLVSVPSSWNRHGYPRIGYGTYRLTLRTPGDANVMMYVPEILSAAAVWVNGEKIFSAGQVGRDRESFVSYAKSDLVVLPEGTAPGAFEIVVQASNYEKINGGIRHAFRVGLGSRENPLTRALFGRWCALAGVAGAFFVIGLYYLALFLFQRGEARGHERGDRIYLVFAASCLLIGVRLVIDQNSLAQFFLRSDPINTRLSLIYNVGTGLHTVLIAIFSVLAFELKPGRATICALAALLGLPFIGLAVLPAPLSRLAVVLYIPSLLAIVALTAQSLSLEKIRSRPYLGLYLISLVFFLCWGVFINLTANPNVFAGFILQNTFNMLAQFVMLSQDYTEARRRTRELAAKEAFYHQMAHDLLMPLTIVSTSVQVAKRRPDEADALLTHSQEEIMKMARMVNDALEHTGGRDDPGEGDA